MLIADDDGDFAETCSLVLESHGYEVSIALRGTEAQEKYRIKDPIISFPIAACRISAGSSGVRE
jgi:CheY-like chemotaxis protein